MSGKIHDAAVHGGCALDGLEPDGEVVDGEEHGGGGGGAEEEGCAGGDAPVEDDPERGGERGMVAVSPLTCWIAMKIGRSSAKSARQELSASRNRRRRSRPTAARGGRDTMQGTRTAVAERVEAFQLLSVAQACVFFLACGGLRMRNDDYDGHAAEDGAQDAAHADDEAVGGDEEGALCQRERDPRATQRRRP